MTNKTLILWILFATCTLARADQLPIVVGEPIKPAAPLIEELVAQSKLAKDYFMYSQDPAAGRNFEERTENLSRKVRGLLKEFTTKRKTEYHRLNFQFNGSDWATNKHTSKTETIPRGQYIFYKINRTTNGDWKGGPTIAGINRELWFSEDIPGGEVTWTTGGKGKAKTKWTIDARYADSYVDSKVGQEVNGVKMKLNALNIPADEVAEAVASNAQ